MVKVYIYQNLNDLQIVIQTMNEPNGCMREKIGRKKGEG